MNLSVPCFKSVQIVYHLVKFKGTFLNVSCMLLNILQISFEISYALFVFIRTIFKFKVQALRTSTGRTQPRLIKSLKNIFILAHTLQPFFVFLTLTTWHSCCINILYPQKQLSLCLNLINKATQAQISKKFRKLSLSPKILHKIYMVLAHAQFPTVPITV